MKKYGELNMDKLKTRVLFVALIILALVSVSAVAAADVDDVVSADQDEIDLSEETITDDSALGDLDPEYGDIDPNPNPTGSSKVTVKINYINKTTGEWNCATTTNSAGWTITVETKCNQTVGIANMNNFTFDGNRYVFTGWKDDQTGQNIVTGEKKSFNNYKDEDGYSHNYTYSYTAQYTITPLGSLNCQYVDNFGNGGGGESHTADDVTYEHTFKEPADYPKDNVVFLYWERNDTGDKFNPGDKMTVTPAEYEGIVLNITVTAVYDIKTSIELEEITGYFGDVVDITAKITEKAKNGAVPGGTATLTIDFTKKLSDGTLAAGTYTDTVEVVDGQAVFKDIKLDATPGTYSYKVEYSGYPYNKHEEGINKYLTSEAESKVNILPLNTTTTSEDVSGTVGDKKDITADIVDQNGDPVQNGTAVLKVNGKEYKAEVENGKAVFKDVELPDESTEATIEYLGNEYYNPSNTTIQITVTQPEEPEEEPEDEPVDEPEEEPSTPVAEKAIPVTPAAGNPIALVVLALLTLVSTVSFGRKK